MLLILNNVKTGSALSEALLFLGVSEGLSETQVSLLRDRSDLDATVG
jgi:hypothetical protein